MDRLPPEGLGSSMSIIANTDVATTKPWPADRFIQGGASGVVIVSDGDNYETAFVEVFQRGSFIRGEGTTVTEAEEHAWEKYQLEAGCQHEYETRGYTNGAGFCTRCGQFQVQVFSGEQLGQLCKVCGVGTTWSRYSTKAHWTTDRRRSVTDPDPSGGDWFCRDHEPFKDGLATDSDGK